ncbi:M9 family metallopeptidase [Kitasatospora humi]|uniref:M9 family metallopeptidase n=1 Tax=Kitasatospora humi TaxID=2893891 RepID=UPI0024C04B24|nr:collagenase [Kitasatospora humi]
MRPLFRLPRGLAVLAAASTALVGALAVPSSAAPTQQAPQAAPQTSHAGLLPPTGVTKLGTSDQDAVQHQRLAPAQLPPRSPQSGPKTALQPRARTSTAAASCTPADFSSRTGSALAAYVQAATSDCISSLFQLTGSNASGVFRESQMLSVASAFQAQAAAYTGDDSTGIWQLGYFLQAGYYVQYYDSADVGSYDATLTSAVQSGLDAFVASPHLGDVSDANGQVAGEAMVLIDSANLQGRYLSTYKQVLNAYNPATYNSSWYMVNFVNEVFTPLYRGHQNPDFVTAVTSDPSIISTLDGFALNHKDLLGTGNSFLDSNAGLETARFIEHPALQATVRPLIKGLLDGSSITGPTAPLWVGVAGMASYYDSSNCSYYGVCNLPQQLKAAALPISHTCDATHSILAQSLTAADLSAVCSSLENQDSFFHNLVKDNGPIPGQYENSLQMVVFASPQDYQTYAGGIYGVSTNNGGITLVGDPTNPGNQPISLTYQNGDDGFTAGVWNLNHEYTHALDGRYDMKGNFTQQTVVPDVWWIEGVAEYVSYTYRNVTDTGAVAEAPKHTYALSTLFQNTYSNSDQTRTYPWGYLAVRYMVERHPDVIANMLSHFRTGDYTGGYAVYNSIGTAYDADFNSWLDACAAGACTAGTGTIPGTTACTAADTRVLDQNCYRTGQSATAGNLDYYYIYLPAGTTTLKITAGGGNGTAYLLYNPNTWATPSAYTNGSFNSGTSQSLTVTNATAGYRYISLYAQTDFSGVTITTQY